MNVKKNGIFFFLLLAGGLIFFSSCASTARTRESRLYVWLANGAQFILLPPENIEKPMDNQQLVSASYNGRVFQANAWVKADETGIDMTLMSELGTSFGELSYRDGAVSFSSPVLPQSIGGEYLVADFQLCFYNTLALRKALEDCGLTLEDMGTSRRVLQGETLIIEIEKSPNVVKLVNHLRGYSYTLEGDF